ncbi:DNA/RNA non-specific endonuclease [Bordetella avium]|uniref:DNA/RNA non-specific endonuclease n=1 Tax=Bordetella avium TaxID=521 RepID=UPI000E1640A7|nr:endonuclease [Bordetella avium]
MTRRTSAPRRTSRSANKPKGFLRALIVSSLVSFGAATYALAPELGISPAEVLHRLGWSTSTQTAPLAAPVGEMVQTRFADCPQFFPQGQTPLVPASKGLRELCFSAFAILHNGQTKTPVVVVERLNRDSLQQAQGMARTDKFYAEARLPSAERAELNDYRGSGYSRGHMAPAGDMATKEAMAQSFSLANMVPQDQKHNAGPWSRVEQDTRRYAMRAGGDVYVFTGPVYRDKPKTIGGSGVAVPSEIFKLVYDATTGRSWVHWQANSPDVSKVPDPISYEEFVKRTGMRLLPKG